MVRKLLASLLFLYALWQVITAIGALQTGQGLAQIFWAVLATLGGVYLWKGSKKAS